MDRIRGQNARDGIDARGTASGAAARACALALVLAAGTGCTHSVLIRTVPDGATIKVDGEDKGAGPVIVERAPGLFGQMAVTVELEGFATERTVVEQSEWFLWPALLAIIPFVALPLAVFFPVGTIFAIAWAVVTSPTLLGLAFLRVYPDEVVVVLEPRKEPVSGEFLPTDWWTIPEEYAPNPLPDVETPEDPASVDPDANPSPLPR